ncbi:conserved hypothetical protein [Vibrio nigripulchritudo SFn27]|uniref:Uncharacterized protein n=1 Tax=Vibrio nigripulchritudo TaxID=28173 RepID=U4KHV3_9VIBR|nr:hypothetical protein [Vibrio nigripulchritudo]CCN82934.1 conserved hypothetical protein [Vibrio nigripulchritudo BLFn1]CCN89594.1 conserved hypothetical protein [Vibrio nigripulchritudo SFn27]CCN94448.1 conserved hypothetical protein [Vibrio nigripulchritudo ENn2]CCO39828.1 conserved hypothetical protein [Vibrio nigripulchritudo SFn135]CCO52257.1 conserved hypothetical protein [Vibrio nigripulchritudo Wn13]
MKTVSYLVQVHTLPKDLAEAAENPNHDLYTTSKIYSKLIDTDHLWEVDSIDENGQVWIAVNIINTEGDAEFHTIKIDSGTYNKVDYDNYPIN